MKVLIACKRGEIAERDKYGHCICDKCKEYRYSVQKKNKNRAEYQKEWRRKNKDKIARYSKKWINENKDKRKQVVKSWRDRNPDKVKEMNADAGKKWAKNNKGKRNAIDMRRKASLINRTPSWANLEEIKKIYAEAALLTKQTGIRHEVDHIIPLQGKIVSGLHVHNNLQILTISQNRSKQNKIYE